MNRRNVFTIAAMVAAASCPSHAPAAAPVDTPPTPASRIEHVGVYGHTMRLDQIVQLQRRRRRARQTHRGKR